MLRYQFLVRREQFWLPVALVGLFIPIVLILAGHPYRAQAAGSLIGLVFPLVGGILAASAVVEDPALELQMAAPRAPWRGLAECSAVIAGIIAICSVVYQFCLVGIGVDLTRFGDLFHIQLLWLVPTVALVALAGLTAALTAQGTLAALIVGGIWLFEILARGWLAAGPVGRKLLVFIGVVDPEASDLLLCYGCIMALSLAMLVLAGWLLRRTERYL